MCGVSCCGAVCLRQPRHAPDMFSLLVGVVWRLCCWCTTASKDGGCVTFGPDQIQSRYFSVQTEAERYQHRYCPHRLQAQHICTCTDNWVCCQHSSSIRNADRGAAHTGTIPPAHSRDDIAHIQQPMSQQSAPRSSRRTQASDCPLRAPLSAANSPCCSERGDQTNTKNSHA